MLTSALASWYAILAMGEVGVSGVQNEGEGGVAVTAVGVPAREDVFDVREAQ